ncbi:LamG-like jellyroll fold domain-containing protein [Gayadomonas joobiniege]|uniref:LamG-like jellyroll fold domain-containing protein n=1 Tax=Gayadomonas joobiniege TaxID=1234606 RepID=UPI00037928D4|nr:LamG-like jellyroll fold domain-containing protein [Gayadomonas joobiniege]
MSEQNQLTSAQIQLLSDYMAGEYNAAEILQQCRHSPAFKRALVEQVGTDRLLNIKLAATNSLTKEAIMARISPSRYQQQKTIKRWSRWGYGIAAGVLLMVSILMFNSYQINSNRLVLVTKVAASVSASQPLLAGRTLQVGRLTLDSGYSELKLNNGVILVLEAPVELNIKSNDLVILTKGKLVAKVPENAIGFKVATPSSEIIDLGTEFAVDVNEVGDSQIHVLDGEVKARGKQSQRFEHLHKDQGLSISMSQKIARIKSQPHLFMRVLPGKSADKPDYLHWSFEQKTAMGFVSSGTMKNANAFPAIDRSEQEGGAALKHESGVFGKAVYFNGINNWLETEFPGIAGNHPRTLAFWLKVPADFDIHQAFGIVSWGVQKNYASWQISPNPYPQNGPLGRLRVGTYNAQIVGSTDLRDGQWHHIAVVMYGGQSSDISTHVLIYVDGQLEKTHGKSIARLNTQITDQASRPLSLGRNIGYREEDVYVRDKFFRGAVDELFVFAAALDQQQIIRLMKQNKIEK